MSLLVSFPVLSPDFDSKGIQKENTKKEGHRKLRNPGILPSEPGEQASISQRVEGTSPSLFLLSSLPARLSLAARAFAQQQ